MKNGEGKIRANWFSLGALIGIAELVDVVEMHEGLEGNHSAFGPFCWMLENARLFQSPIPAKGQLRVFNLTADLVAQVRKQLSQPYEIPLEQVSAFRNAHKSDPLEVCLDRADTYLDIGKYEDAFRLYKKASVLDPENADAHFGMGSVHFDKKEYKEAIPFFEKVQELDPEDDEAVFLLGKAHIQLTEYKKGIEICEAIVRRNPDAVHGHVVLHLGYKGLNNKAKAEAHRKKAASLGMIIEDDGSIRELGDEDTVDNSEDG